MESPMSTRHTSFPSWGINTDSWDSKMIGSSRFSSYAKPLTQRYSEVDPFRFGDASFVNWPRDSFSSPTELAWPQTAASAFPFALQNSQRKDYVDSVQVHSQERDYMKRPSDTSLGNTQHSDRDSPPSSTLPSNGPNAQLGRAPKRHVKSACLNCKRAHLSCDVHRPCNRCVQNGKTQGCVDVPQRRKGRPRLRQDSLRKSGRAIAKPLSVKPLANVHDQRPLNPLQNFGYHSGFSMTTDVCNVCSWIPLVFLTIDLRIVQFNYHFRSLFEVFGDLHGQYLEHLTEKTDSDLLQTLRWSLRQELERELTLTSTPVGVLEMGNSTQLPYIETQDIPKIIKPFTNRRETIHFRFADGTSRPLSVEFSLSKTDFLFVTLALPPIVQSQVVVPSSSQPPQYGIPAIGQSSYVQTFNPTRSYYGREFERGLQLQLPSPDSYTQFPISPSSYSMSSGASVTNSSRQVSVPSQRSYDQFMAQMPAGNRQSATAARLDGLFVKGLDLNAGPSTGAQTSVQNGSSSGPSYLAPLQDRAPSMINSSRTLPPIPGLGSPDSQASDNATAQPARSQQTHWQNQGQDSSAAAKPEPKASGPVPGLDWQVDSPSRRSRLDMKELAT